MTIDESVKYLTNKAKAFGYTDKMISAFDWELREVLYRLDDWSEKDLDEVFEEIF